MLFGDHNMKVNAVNSSIMKICAHLPLSARIIHLM